MRAATIALLSVLAACRSWRELGESLAAEFELGWRVHAREEPDLTVAPGSTGYVDGLATTGPQLHYHSPKLSRTVVAGEVPVEDETWWGRIGSYEGSPSRAGAVRRCPPPAILLVTVVDRKGEPCPDVGVRVESPDGDYVAFETDENGVARFEPRAGTWFVRRDDAFLWFPGKRHEVVLPPRAKVERTLGRDGLRYTVPGQ